ncbi:serine/threonine-protein kinase [Streptomyces sp. NPDC012888]|uniref:serine/threonine-protein kinase n=1 Tax=Streptomyces sp. NPDC012888 TaxID=3364855 RepID=UPI0036B31B4B
MEALKDTDPAQIGAHALLARLGAGGMGQVYLARSPGGRLVAVKVIRDEITGHPEALARFRREAETVRAVRSAYTANLIDASLAAPPYWLATEYVAGPTLAHAVSRHGALPADTCRRLFAALAEGLASVHAYGVTHRDLKPQNVILGAQGPQLIDFGIAKGVGATMLTHEGQAPGTPGYTAPEVLVRGESGGDPADVFALGATMAYAATGRPPFGVGDAATVSYRAVHEAIDVTGVEPELAELIRACVEKDPGARPDPAEIIRRCAVRVPLVDDPVYQGLGSLAAPVPVHEMRTQGPGYGYTPTHAGSPTSAPDRRRRTGRWVAAGTVAAVLGGVAVWQLPLDGGEGGSGADAAGGRSPAAQTPGVGGTPQGSAGPTASPAGPPTYIRAKGKDVHHWNAVRGRCDSFVEGDVVPQFQTAITTPETDHLKVLSKGSAKVEFRLKYETPNNEPYYVAVAVKPPYETDDQGRLGTELNNEQLGFVAKAQNLFAGDEKEWKALTYPDDFSMRTSSGKVIPAPPLDSMRGEWTVVFHHAKSDTEYKSILCDGFAT